jgi:hypothetical protein
VRLERSSAREEDVVLLSCLERRLAAATLVDPELLEHAGSARLIEDEV